MKQQHALSSQALDAFNNSVALCGNQMALWIVGRDSNNNVQAGIYGVTLFDWLIIKWVWVADRYRRQGIGSQIVLTSEHPQGGLSLAEHSRALRPIDIRLHEKVD